MSYSPFNSTLKSIQEFVEDQVERNVLLRVIGSTADVGKIKEYRENLQQAVNQFMVSNLIHNYNIKLSLLTFECAVGLVRPRNA